MTIATQGIRFGAFTPTPAGGDPLEGVNLFELKTGRRQDIINNFRKWGGASGNWTQAKVALEQTSKSGRVPMISWEPLDYAGKMGDYSLDSIIEGKHDAYLREWAEGLRDFGITAYLRPMHEMNGNWYHWSGRPTLYVAVWQHIHDIFSAAGASNVKFIWCANVSDAPWGQNPMEGYWPGSRYVDVLGIDSYNCYTGWRPWGTNMRTAYQRVCALDPELPVWVCETATSEPAETIKFAVGNTKAQWIADLFATENYERVEAVVWFDQFGGFDWRIDTSESALKELRRQLKLATGWVPAPPPYIPPVPLSPVVTGVNGRSDIVNVRWRAGTTFLRGYRVYRRTVGARDWELATTIAKPTTTATVPVEAGVRYQFAVTSFTGLRASPFSKIVEFQA